MALYVTKEEEFYPINDAESLEVFCRVTAEFTQEALCRRPREGDNRWDNAAYKIKMMSIDI